MLDDRWKNVRRLLAVRLDNAGDVLMCEPALRSIRKAIPECEVTLWASPGGARMAGLLPEVDRALTTRALWQDLGNLPFDPQRERDVVQTLADGGYDGAVVFTSFAQSPYPPSYACYLAGIPLRAGQPRDFAGGVLSDVAAPPPLEAHQVDRNLSLVASLGFPPEAPELTARIPDEARDSLGLKLRLKGIGLGRPFVLIHPGASCSARRYPVDRYAEVARLTRRALHWPVVISGSEQEKGLEDSLLKAAGPGVTSLIGQTSVEELATLVERATVVVTNNTVTMHLADALRTPEVVLFSGTEREEQWQPRVTRARLLRRPTWCQPCYRFTCPYGLPCLDLPPEEVVAAMLELVADTAR